MENEDEDEDCEETRRDEHGARLVYDTGRDTTEMSFVLASGDLGERDIGGWDVEGRLGRDITRLVDRPEGRDKTRRDACLVFSFILDSDRPSSRSQ